MLYASETWPFKAEDTIRLERNADPLDMFNKTKRPKICLN